MFSIQHELQQRLTISLLGRSESPPMKTSLPGPLRHFSSLHGETYDRTLYGWISSPFLIGAEEHLHGVLPSGTDLRIKNRWQADGVFPSNEKKTKPNPLSRGHGSVAVLTRPTRQPVESGPAFCKPLM